VVLLPAVAVTGVSAAMLLPALAAAKEKAQRIACINNLRQIDAVKNEWALEKNKVTGDTPTEADILPYLAHNQMPKCPAGGRYTIGVVGQPPTCSVRGHMLP
jgi:hypothetical protein